MADDLDAALAAIAPRTHAIRRWRPGNHPSFLLMSVVVAMAAVACAGMVDAQLNNDAVATTTTTPQQPQQQQRVRRRRRRMQEDQDDSTRPVMHTFFSRLDGKREKGMNDEVDAQMLEVWKSSWAAAGWEPKVLTLEDAKKHPQYDRVNSALDDLPFGEYDRLCFLRWLAMAANGGGWMSGYDTFPVHAIAERTLQGGITPNEGRFTVYDHLVPSLVSGSAEEWDRMARLLVENAVAHKNEKFWSDMFAMVNLFETHDPNIFISTRQVQIGSRVLTSKHFGQEDCDKLRGKVAIHFSHSSIHWGKLRDGEGFGDRPRIAANWLNIFKDRCTREEVAVSGPTTSRQKRPSTFRPTARY